jgi:hypothetical protein
MYLADRFWSKVQVAGEDECWPWLASKCGAGYGKFWHGVKDALVSAHRVAYELTWGDVVPQGYDVCHTCDNKACVNPSHLFVGTRADNVKDMYRKRRHPIQKLTAEMVQAIKADLSTGLSQQKVADRFGLNQVTVSRIKRDKVLTHLA